MPKGKTQREYSPVFFGLIRLYIFNLQLYFSPFVGVFLNGVTDVERTLGLDVAHVRTLPESNAVHYIVRFVVHQFQLDMLLVASYDFTGSVVVHVVSTEYGLGIVGTEGVELLQIIAEFGSDIPEVDFGIDVDYGAGLFRQNMPGYEFFETFGESGYILHFHGQTGSIGMSAEVFQ